MMGRSPPHVLVIAYACEPGKGSEPGVGWHWALELAKAGDVTVITRANNRTGIDAALAAYDGPAPRFCFYDPQSIFIRLKPYVGLLVFHTLWQLGAAWRAMTLSNTDRFTHILQLTFGNIWLPVFTPRCGGKIIWGPLGGGESIPPSLQRKTPIKARFIETIRRILVRGIGINPFVAIPLYRADKILVRTGDTLDILPHWAKTKTQVVLETAIDPAFHRDVASKTMQHANEIPIILFTGRLVGFKNLPLLLHAAAYAHVSGAAFHLRIIGDGPERKNLKTLCSKLNLTDAVTFTGAMPRADVIMELHRADIYAFPSLREAGSWSLMEAMSAGLPVVCMATSGMGVITDEASAIRINPERPEHVEEEFSHALMRLCKSRDLRLKIGRAARKRIKDHFLWSEKGHEIRSVVFANKAVGPEDQPFEIAESSVQ